MPARQVEVRANPAFSSFEYLLRDISRLHTALFETLADTKGLMLADAKVLATISRYEGTTQAQLAHISGIGEMSLVRILDRMEKVGWVRRYADSKDRRVNRLQLCPAAKSALESIDEVAAHVRTIALAQLQESEREDLISLLEKVRQNLVERNSAAR